MPRTVQGESRAKTRERAGLTREDGGGGAAARTGRLEERLGAAEALVANGDDLAVRKLVRLLEGRRLGGGLHLLVEVEGDVGELLLDVTDDLALGGRGL